MSSTSSTYTPTALFIFSGIGAGAMGFLQSHARLGAADARFISLGGIDNDPLACADFEYLTNSPALCADINAVTPEQLREFVAKAAQRAGVPARRPDVVFGSPPCKGFSRLLSSKMALTEKYQKLNRLVLQSLFLVCETWRDDLPPAILIENVPAIQSRGIEVLRQVRQLLSRYGYIFDEATHNCGEIGGLGQNRIRYLLIARRPKAVPAFIYRPPRLRVKGCGEILETLPMPEDDEAGDLHRLPMLSWLNWVRLALIPAGGDWRDLPGAVNVDADAQRAWEQEGKKTSGGRHWFKGKHGVLDWKRPARAVIGGPSNGASNVADPRIAGAVKLGRTGENADGFKGRPGHMGVLAWDEPSRAVNGTASVSTSTGSSAVADPRIPEELRCPVAPGAERRSQFPKYDIRAWNQPARTVAGSGTNGGFGVADPRLAAALGFGSENPNHHEAKFRVTPWAAPAHPVTGSRPVTSGGPSVADPRIALDHSPRPGAFGVKGWEEPAATVRGNASVRQAPSAVADPRLKVPPLGIADPSRGGALGVLRLDRPAPTITGNVRAGSSNTPGSVADPRIHGDLAFATLGATIDPRLGCTPRRGMYGVLSWEEAAATVIGNARVDNGTFAVADPRKALPKDKLPIIVSADGTWHRPLTKLELAALQGLPARVAGRPLKLATMESIGRKGEKAPSSVIERIGNAVPVGAARAIGESILTALLSASLGTWMLSSEAIWVRKDGVTEYAANAPWLAQDLAREDARHSAACW